MKFEIRVKKNDSDKRKWLMIGQFENRIDAVREVDDENYEYMKGEMNSGVRNFWNRLYLSNVSRFSIL